MRLSWNSVADEIAVVVQETRDDEASEIPVAAANALLAFPYPYAYANCPRPGHSIVL